MLWIETIKANRYKTQETDIKTTLYKVEKKNFEGIAQSEFQPCVMLNGYSTDRTQPNTKADPESGPEVRFGSATSPLFKNLRPLWVR